jgi:hypothetical protein
MDPAFDPAFGITTRNYLDHGTTVGLSHHFSRRGSVRVAYSRNQTNLNAANGHQVYQLARAGFSYALTKGLGLQAGYGASQRGTTGQRGWQGGEIDAGLSFNRSLSLTRRASFGFRTGATGVETGGVTRYLLTGSANLNYELGRSWTAGLSYVRNTQFIDTVEEPLIGDAVSFDIGGLISRRVQLNTAVAARTGRFGIAAAGSKFRSGHARINLSVALSRYLAINSDYTYMTYDSGTGAVLPGEIRPRAERHSLRVRLSSWIPLIVRTRSADASR